MLSLTLTDNVDFTSLPAILNFPANSTEGSTQCASVSINNNFFFQKTRYFNAIITPVEDDSLDDIIIQVPVASVHILNDDRKSWAKVMKS
jgi:hypothetical protein